MMKRIKTNFGLVLTVSFVFILFAFCTYWTPLAGDDWGYAINGMKANPLVMAYEFYFSWSGRFFSELWGFIVAPNKWLWNILNPLLFAGIIACVNGIANREKTMINYASSLFMMLFVSANLRMETYTWIMGTTYVIPLFLSLLYLSNYVHHILNEIEWKKWEVVLFSFVQFYIGLTMENIAAVMVLIHILMIIRNVFHHHDCKKDILFLAISLFSFIIMRGSPGSAYRLSENTVWNQLSFVEQITSNLSPFLRYTFYDNKYLVGLLIVALGWTVIFSSKNEKNKIKWVLITVFVSFGALLLLVSNKVYSVTSLGFFGWLSNYEMDFSSLMLQVVFWIGYIIYLFIVFCYFYTGTKREMLMFFLLIAGASNLVMLISPIFGSRSSIYFYYFAMVIVMLVIEDIKLPKSTYLGIVCILMLLSMYRGYDTLKKYRLVNTVHQDRIEKIQYYLDHPEEKDVWLPRMPIYTVHGADIEPEDTYHMDVFKAYYGLSEDCTLHFYVEE